LILSSQTFLSKRKAYQTTFLPSVKTLTKNISKGFSFSTNLSLKKKALLKKQVFFLLVQVFFFRKKEKVL
jgi:hypothetical protein